MLPDWSNQDCYIIGGGSSLKNFDWLLLENLNTIGCNDAYKLGDKICKVCIFGDYSWWEHHKTRLMMYTGVVVTNACKMANEAPSWVHYFLREHGRFKKDTLCWAGNTGVSAINLALILGAKTVYLLGFDMGIKNGETNWHDEVIHPNAVLPSSYTLFKKRWIKAIPTLNEVFPDRSIVNINDTSRLEGIENVKAEVFWS